jgi:hypothetical protein
MAFCACVAAKLAHFGPQEEDSLDRPASWRGPLQDFFCCNVLVHERTDAGKKLPAETAWNQNDLW